jgi:uncharacterized membrane protein
LKARITQYWDSLRTSYWFVPTWMALGSAALAFGSLALDEALDRKTLRGLIWVYTGGPQGARGVLAAIAGSTITVAGVVFSITMVVLSLTAQQFGPRLLRNFMKNQSTQIVLGTFVATFLYSLLVLRAVRGSDFDEFVPHVSVTIAVALSVASIGLLIFFIHHVSMSIQVDSVIAAAHAEVRATIDRLFPTEMGDEPPDGRTRGPQDAAACCTGPSSAVRAPITGYLQAIDVNSIVHLASQAQIVVAIHAAAGDYVLEGQSVAEFWSSSPPDDDLSGRLAQVFVIGQSRTTRQDSRYAVRQLVEVALRALSPGINDPFTAVSCLDRLGGSLSVLAQRPVPLAYRYDDEGHLRAIAEPDSFEALARAAFVEIRYFGRNNVTVMRHLIESLGRIAGHAQRPPDLDFLRRFLESVKKEAIAALQQDDDQEAIVSAYNRAMAEFP